MDVAAKQPQSRIWDARTGRSIANPAAAAAAAAAAITPVVDNRSDIAQRSVIPQQPMTPLQTGSPTISHELPPPIVVVRPVAVLRGHARAVSALAWSHDGRRLASGYVDGTVVVWDAWGSV